MIKMVIFDLDGTLVDTIDGIRYSADLALSEFGYTGKEREFYIDAIGNGAKNLIEKAIIEQDSGDLSLSDQILKKFLYYYGQHWEKGLNIYEGIEKLIVELKRKGIMMAVNTNKPQEFALEMVEYYFDKETILSVKANCIEYEKKPSPEGVNMIMNEFFVLPDECIYIGDSIVDIETAKNANIKCITVSWGYGKKEDLNKSDYLVNNANEILDIINSIQ